MLNVVICILFKGYFASVNPVIFLAGYLISGFIGCVLTTDSESIILRFLGYHLIVVPVGLVVSICVADAYAVTVFIAIIATAIISISALIAGIIYPDIFNRLGSIVIWGLLSAIIAEAIILLLFKTSTVIIDIIVILIMVIAIGYDFNRAHKDVYNVNNAISYATQLYLDIINIFVRVLSIMNSNSSKEF